MIALALGIPAGILAAAKPGSVSDYVGTALALVGLSVPHFWLGLMLILIVSVDLGLLPASGYTPFSEDPVENLRHMILPAIVLGTVGGGDHHAPDALGDARVAGRRLRAHRARQGAVGALGGRAATRCATAC